MPGGILLTSELPPARKGKKSVAADYKTAQSVLGSAEHQCAKGPKERKVSIS